MATTISQAALADDPRLKRLLDAIVSGVKPDAIYLFGSRARGHEHADSDYDLLVVLPDETPREHRDPVWLYRFAQQSRVAADIVPCSRTGFDRYKDEVGTLIYEATHFGVKVHGR